ncbi:hypothetical protein FRC09_013822 [Ceratobasidium sp. 395]|nr:hypothetical protein FRC09_013822 [Ceratobasidium sp. 395]
MTGGPIASTSSNNLDTRLNGQTAPHSRSQRRRRRVKPSATSSTFNETPSDPDPQWTDLPEKEKAYGPRPDELARLITRRCYPSDETYTGANHHVRCIASSVCGTVSKAADRQRDRIFKHAARCRALSYWKPDLFAAAERALANMAPGGFPSLVPSDDSGPSIKLESTAETPQPLDASNPFARFDTTASMTHLQKIDHALVRLLCDSATPARLVDYSAWNQFVHAINPQLGYSSPSASLISNKLIPAESQRAVLHMREYLKTQTNISLSFDGLTSGEQPVYTVHVCTADRRTFLYYADVFYGSHNSDYIEDLLVKVITELGPHRVSSVVSDDTSVTKKARRLATSRHASILNLADPVHKLNLCIQDICQDKLWTSVLNRLRKILTHFKISTQATAKLNAARKILGILRRLQSIGKTRFATLYYAAISVLENLPALYKIYRDHEIDTTTNPLPDAVSEALDEKQVTAIEFKLMLTELVNILEPIARALLCLESTESTLGDVYFFWLAALAVLNRHFASRNNTLLTLQDMSRLQAKIYYRFNEAMNEAPTDTYVTAFFLDPRYRTASIYLDMNTFFQAPPILNWETTKRSTSRSVATRSGSRLTESLYVRVRKQLMRMLRDELKIGQNLPDHPFYQYDALRAQNELTTQLNQYHQGLPPFRQFNGSTEGALQYWQSHKDSYLTFVLANLAAKLFSVLPNSMCDERAGSRLTHMYSKLRTRMDAKTMIEQIQFSQFMSMVDGSEAVARRKKASPRSRFYEIDQSVITEHASLQSADDCAVALSDEPGENWLDRQGLDGETVNTEIEFGECPSLEGALRAHCIDLNSETLASALSMTPGGTIDLSSGESRAAASNPATVAFASVSDVSWDID